jgi:hypothetical protein
MDSDMRPSSVRLLGALFLAVMFSVSAEAQTSGALKPTPQAQHYLDLASTPQRVQEFLSGKTRMTGDDRHGTQVEYNAPDGNTYLWYPGSSRITRGFWKAEAFLAPDGIHRPVRVCYKYPLNSVDPTDGSRGGDWSCGPGWYSLMRTKDTMNGDPFGLSRSGAAPFILPPAPTTLAQLLQLKR